MKLLEQAAMLMDAALARVVAVDTEGVTLDHVAIEALIAAAGALEAAIAEPAAATLILEEARKLLDELPGEAGHGAFQELIGQRSVTRVQPGARYVRRSGG